MSLSRRASSSDRRARFSATPSSGAFARKPSLFNLPDSFLISPSVLPISFCRRARSASMSMTSASGRAKTASPKPFAPNPTARCRRMKYPKPAPDVSAYRRSPSNALAFGRPHQSPPRALAPGGHIHFSAHRADFADGSNQPANLCHRICIHQISASFGQWSSMR